MKVGLIAIPILILTSALINIGVPKKAAKSQGVDIHRIVGDVVRISSFKIDKSSFISTYLVFVMGFNLRRVALNYGVDVTIEKSNGTKFNKKDDAQLHRTIRTDDYTNKEVRLTYSLPVCYLDENTIFTFVITESNLISTFFFELSNLYFDTLKITTPEYKLHYKVEIQNNVVYEYYDMLTIEGLYRENLFRAYFNFPISKYIFKYEFAELDIDYSSCALFIKDPGTDLTPFLATSKDSEGYRQFYTGVTKIAKNEHRLFSRLTLYLNESDQTMKMIKSTTHNKRVTAIYFPKEKYEIYKHIEMYYSFSSFGYHSKNLKFYFSIDMENKDIDELVDIVVDRDVDLEEDYSETVIL
jgi:hypothetical protein